MCALDLVLQMSKTPHWNHSLGTAGMNSICQLCVPAVASPNPLLHHSHIPSGWPRKIPLPWPVIEYQSEDSSKVTHIAGGWGAGCPPWFLFSHLSAWGSGETSQYDTVLAWEMGNMVNMELFSYLLLLSVLVSVVQRVLLPQSSVVGFSQWFLVLGQLLVVLVRRSQEQLVSILVASQPIMLSTSKDQFWSMAISCFVFVSIYTYYYSFLGIFVLNMATPFFRPMF